MKRLSLITALILFFSVAYGQQKKQYIYCQLVGTHKLFSTKVTVAIDYGQERKMFKNNLSVRDDEGKIKSFNSMVDALNYMGSQGWEFLQANTIIVDNQHYYIYLLKKEADTEDLEYLKNITTKNTSRQEPDRAEEKSTEVALISAKTSLKDKSIVLDISFEADKKCTQKNSNIRIWLDSENFMLRNTSENNCKGNISVVFSDKALLERVIAQKISVLQVNTDKGIVNINITNGEGLKKEFESLYQQIK